MIATIVGAVYPVLSLAAVICLVVASNIRRWRGLRLTRTRRAVLVAINDLDRPTDLAIYNATGYGPGRVYPALDVLLQAGWIGRRAEPSHTADQSTQVVYHLTYRGQLGTGFHTKDHS